MLTAKTDDRPASSAFWDAVLEYRRTRATSNKKSSFLDESIDSEKGCSIDDVQDSIYELERANSGKISTRIIRKILKPVITVLNDYAGVLGILCNADPMPTALIWGILKAAVECSNRYLSLYEKIGTQLRSLTSHLHRLVLYEELFVHSIVMQEELKKSYINVLKFWSRVAKECNRNAYATLGRAVTSFSTRKLDKILDDLSEDADVIAKFVSLVQQQENIEDRKKSDEERRLAAIARTEISSYILDERNSRLQRETERRRVRQRDVRDWIRAENAVNLTRFQQDCSRRHPQTCQWILEDQLFKVWLDGINEELESPTLWLRGPPGVGKSIMSALVIETIRNIQPMPSIAFQYYSANEQYSALDTLRNIADQLLDQLWDDTHDIPDHIHAHVQHTRGDKDRVLKLIELLVGEMNGVYIFLDGLDETCGIDTHWREIKQVLSALCRLSSCNSGNVKLWISSQDRAPIRKALSGFSCIDMTEETIALDINTFFNDSMFLEVLNVGPESRGIIVRELNERAKGNFLYAYLMADSLQHAENLKDLETQIQENLPRKLDDYYHHMLARIDKREYPLFSKILAFVTFAKRPLRLTELREAIACQSLPENNDLTPEDLPAMSRIKQSCEPLLKVLGDVNNPQVCSITLSHSTVRAFLIHNPDIFRNGQVLDKAISISEDEVAGAVLRYLMQPRYCYPLMKGTDIWRAALGENVGDHHLLTYAAKYWDKHSDKVSTRNRSMDHILRFVQSPQFAACLQIQSLSVEGHFGLYLPKQVWVPPHMKRIFPRWFSECSEIGKMISKDYQKFASEWGAILEHKCLGELDYCLLGALGRWNFLGRLESRYDSFIFARSAGDEDKTSLLYEDIVSSDGSKLVRVISQSTEHFSFDKRPLDVEFMIQTWSSGPSVPSLDSDQIVRVNSKCLLDFDAHPFGQRSDIGTPAVIAASSDLKGLRIGSQVLCKDHNSAYTPIVLGDGKEESVEDLTSRNQYLAVARRRSRKSENAESSIMDGNVYAEFSEFIDSFFEDGMLDGNADPGVPFDINDPRPGSMFRPSNSQFVSRFAEEDLEYPSFPRDVTESTASGDDEFPDMVSTFTNASIDENSAYEWESMIAPSEISDASSDYEEWNETTSSESNFDLSSEKLEDLSDLEDAESINSTKLRNGTATMMPDGLINGLIYDPPLRENFVHFRTYNAPSAVIQRWFQGNSNDSDNDSDNVSLASDQTEWSSEQSSDYNSVFDRHASGSDVERSNAGGERLDHLLGAKARAQSRKTNMGKEGLRIYDTSFEPSKQIFHFSQDNSEQLYSSPPAIHPTEPLVVWSLGGGEVMFVDFANKTYFSRRLNRSSRKACYVSIRFFFSSCGRYLHIVALEARRNEVSKPNFPGTKETLLPPDTPLRLSMQISTHRLSARKPTRCAPRLIFRSQVDLGLANSIPISRLPYTLTWTDEFLYLTHNDPNRDFQILKIFKVPLHGSLQSETDVQVLDQELYLPRSSANRTIYYFPLSITKSPEIVAGTVILSSTHIQTSAFPVRGHTAAICYPRPHNRKLPHMAPIGFRVNETHPVKWKALVKESSHAQVSQGRMVGGRLQRKFERFDKEQDRDIIAFLS